MKLVLLALVVAACGSKDAPAPKSEPPPRSGKIDLPSAPGGAAGSSGMRDGRIPDMRRDRSGDESLRGDRGPRRDRNRGAQDTDGDGVISPEERADSVEKRMAEMKARADKNGDGTVSEEEIAAGRRDRAENMLGRLDKDGDGKLTVAEIGESRMRRFDAAAADTNKDGTITIEELETAMHASGPGPWGRRRDRLNGAGSGSATP
jgi:hypothetical protein